MRIIVSVITIILIEEIVGPLAPTWIYCNCRWDPWKPWSACSKTCGGGVQSRDRMVWTYKTLECFRFTACATTDMGSEIRSCNNFCSNGGTYHSFGRLNGFCGCPKGTKGRCCEQIVTCGTPSSISHGSFTGVDFTYNRRVQYKCDTNYNMTEGAVPTRTCTDSGYWTGRSPSCLYATSCNSNLCKNKAQCVNKIADYQCMCLQGWTGKNCETDVQPPVYDSCPASILLHTSNMTSLQSWKEPIFTDPLGNKIHVTKNYHVSKFTFPWGEYSVQYNAVKLSNGLRTECVFNISVKPIPCQSLLPPKNGILVCNGWKMDYASVCKLVCKAGYMFTPAFKIEDWYNCGATGHWLPPIAQYECVNNYINPFGNKPLITSCDNSTDKQHVQEYYIQALKKSPFNALCEDSKPDCLPSNVAISCN